MCPPVDRQHRPTGFDDAKDSRRRYVGARQHAQRQTGDDIEQGGLATAMKRRANAQPGRDQETVEEVGVKTPQRDGAGGVLGHDDIARDLLRDVVEPPRPVDCLRPRLGLWQVEGSALFCVAGLSAR